jgi:hypothetical protein
MVASEDGAEPSPAGFPIAAVERFSDHLRSGLMLQ